MKVLYNMHTHTNRCGHAIGEDEEYVIEAIKAGIKILGFSDHAFFKDIVHDNVRGRYEKLDEYISSILSLQKKYKKDITIKLGFEIEYQENYYNYYRFLLEEKGFDFLILGQHLIYDEDGNPVYYSNQDDNDLSGAIRYKNDLIKGMETGLFLYVCHPDFFIRKIKNKNKEVENICKEICEASLKYNIPLEINLCGLRKQIHKGIKNHEDFYPNSFFWKIAGEMGVKCVIGIDAHDPDNICNSGIEEALNIVKEFNLNLVEDITTINKNLEQCECKLH